MTSGSSGVRGFAGRGAAELVIIVAGVLVALWIEGWREARVEAATEREYLTRLEADLVADSVRLAGRLDAEIRLDENTRRAMDFVRTGAVPEADTVAVVAALHFSGFINFYRPQSTTWDDLVSTGNLGLIRDRDLRERVGRYYASPALGLLLEMDDNRKEHVWYRYRPSLDRYFPMGQLDRIAAGELPERGYLEIDLDGVRRDAGVEAGLKAANGLAAVYRRQLGVLLDENGAALAALRSTTGEGGDA